MEKHILPADDTEVANLTADLIETLASSTGINSGVSQSSETGELLIELYRYNRPSRRFRLQLIELTDA